MADHVDDAGGGGDTARHMPLAIAVMLLIVAIGGAVDIVLDAPRRWLSAHVLLELALMLTSLGFAAYLWRAWWRTQRSLGEMRRSLAAREAAHRAEREAWRQHAHSALEGLGRAIDRQFDTWALTPAEREVALLVLKGHGHKRIAALTGRSERTVRQHAATVYHKSGLGGRAELAAFFLEDVPLPGEPAPNA